MGMCGFLVQVARKHQHIWKRALGMSKKSPRSKVNRHENMSSRYLLRLVFYKRMASSHLK